MKKLRRSRSAISTLEGALLVLVIIVAAVAGYFGYLATIPPPPAEIVYSDLSVSPTRVLEEEEVTVSVVVENTGGSAWTGDVPLLLNGAVEATESVTLDAGESETVTWTVTKTIGDYTVTVGELVSTFSVGMAIKNPDTLILAYYGEPESLDPAWCYETAGAEAISAMYDRLLDFWHDPDKVIPKTMDPEELVAPTDILVPVLATDVPTVENGLISSNGLTYTFPIRTNVTFWNGDPLTPEDVEYSIERAMVQDRLYGPQWMFLEPLLGVMETRDEEGNIVVPFEDIANSVESNDTHVVFHLASPYPPFLQILAQSWAGIVNKDWCIEQGDWDGTEAGYKLFPEGFNYPTVAENTVLYEKAMGTGPFMFERWSHGEEWTFVRNENYWRGPAKLERVIVKLVTEWATRKLMLQAGDADIVDVDPEFYAETELIPGVRFVRDLPTLIVHTAHFTMDIDPASPNIWSGKLDGAGIPPGFFSDIDVRKAFTYAFDYETFIEEVRMGEAITPTSCIIEGLPFWNPANPTYEFNLTKAEEHFKKAWNGEVWEKGFRLTLAYNIGNLPRKETCEILKDNIESLNTKFIVHVRALEWPTFLEQYRTSMLPVFNVGWLADYPDPHNYVGPFMHSQGSYAGAQGYSNPVVDALIDEGISTINATRREEIYYELQRIWYEDIIGICTDQPIERHFERDWVQGFYYQPVWPGVPSTCPWYDMWKSY